MGVVTGLNVGTASFRFTDVSTGCTSDGSLISSVISPVSVGVNGPTELLYWFMKPSCIHLQEVFGLVPTWG